MDKIQRLENQNVDIRPLVYEDIQQLASSEQMLTQWTTIYKQHVSGLRYTCIITKNDHIVGYGSLLALSAYKPFEKEDIFEIIDLWIVPSERRQGLATLLITYFESIAQDAGAAKIGISIGLSPLAAPAHCLCIRLGYVPTGSGMTYKGIPVVVGKQYPMNDNVRLWFVKDLISLFE